MRDKAIIVTGDATPTVLYCVVAGYADVLLTGKNLVDGCRVCGDHTAAPPSTRILCHNLELLFSNTTQELVALAASLTRKPRMPSGVVERRPPDYSVSQAKAGLRILVHALAANK